MVAGVCQVVPAWLRSGVELGQTHELLERIAGGKNVRLKKAALPAGPLALKRRHR
ncbi:MAG: hypothetical protein JO114_03520 [Planctomycetaceae bacterium]|nr:hypothetical protein [Planctomycetaceae bacterium]